MAGIRFLGNYIYSRRGSFWLALLTILILGTCLRVYKLDQESLLPDECISLQFSDIGLSEVMTNPEIRGYRNPPLYIMILKPWIKLFGNSEYSVRLISVIFGVLTIFMMYKMGGLIFDKQAGFYSALLTTVSLFHIEYSQTARMYSMVSFLSLMSMYFFIKILQKKSAFFCINYLIWSVFLLYTHNYAMFVILVQNLYFLMSRRNSRETTYDRLRLCDWFFLQALLFLAFLPWIGVFTKQTEWVQTHKYPIPKPDIHEMVSLFYFYASGNWWLLAIFLALPVFTVISYYWRKRDSLRPGNFFFFLKHPLDNKYLDFLLLWLATPVIMPVVLSLFSNAMYRQRYTIAASLALYLLLAKSIRDLRQAYAKVLILLIITVLSLGQTKTYYMELRNAQIREAAYYIDKNAKPYDIIFFNDDGKNAIFNHYSKRTDLIKRCQLGLNDISNKEYAKDITGDIKDLKRFWIIMVKPYSKIHSFKKLLPGFREKIHVKDYKKIEIFLFTQEGKESAQD